MVERIDGTMQNIFSLADLEKACFGRDAWNISNLRSEFSNDFSHFFGVFENGEVIAYVCVRILYEEAQICNIAVLPERRRQGLGTSLLFAVVNFAMEQKCRRCELEVNTENIPAVELYRKCGFEEVGVRKNFYRRSRYKSRDAYTMVIELQNFD